MNLLVFLVYIILLIFGIENNNLSSQNNTINKEMKESYEACKKLKFKAPNLNLKCERIFENISNNELKSKSDKIKTLFVDETVTRKVNKNEEKKLRNLIKKLSNENKLRKN